MSSPAPAARPIHNPTEVSHFIDIITHAFSITPITTTFIVELDSTPPPYPSPLITPARRRRHFASAITDAASSGAELVEAGDWSAVALWEPPSYAGKAFADTGTSGPLREEWRERVKAAKERHLRGRRFYHLSFLARNPDVEVVPGSITAVVQPFLARAKAEGVPAWLEATYLKAVKVYERHGFRVVEVITLGAGRINAEGWPEEGGEGVRGWCMIYEP